MSDDEFTMDGALLEAALVPGAHVFVFPSEGLIEAVFVLAPDRMVFELRSESSAGWLDQMVARGLRQSTFIELESALATWCAWVPTMWRGVVLGLQTPDELIRSEPLQ